MKDRNKKCKLRIALTSLFLALNIILIGQQVNQLKWTVVPIDSCFSEVVKKMREYQKFGIRVYDFGEMKVATTYRSMIDSAKVTYLYNDFYEAEFSFKDSCLFHYYISTLFQNKHLRHDGSASKKRGITFYDTDLRYNIQIIERDNRYHYELYIFRKRGRLRK